MAASRHHHHPFQTKREIACSDNSRPLLTWRRRHKKIRIQHAKAAILRRRHAVQHFMHTIGGYIQCFQQQVAARLSSQRIHARPITVHHSQNLHDFKNAYQERKKNAITRFIQQLIMVPEITFENCCLAQVSSESTVPATAFSSFQQQVTM